MNGGGDRLELRGRRRLGNESRRSLYYVGNKIREEKFYVRKKRSKFRIGELSTYEKFHLIVHPLRVWTRRMVGNWEEAVRRRRKKIRRSTCFNYLHLNFSCSLLGVVPNKEYGDV